MHDGIANRVTGSVDGTAVTYTYAGNGFNPLNGHVVSRHWRGPDLGRTKVLIELRPSAKRAPRDSSPEI